MKNKNTGARSTIIAAATLVSLQLVNAKEPMTTTGKDKDEQTSAAAARADETAKGAGVVQNGVNQKGLSNQKGVVLKGGYSDKHASDFTTTPGNKDGSGRVIHQDSKGQKFTLDPKTGDKVPVK